ncbi:MAG TPA: CheR family methyltransferase [Polyangiaceae bacterium]|nr:CheR family methyltransferase [Polyangiaceae bacterium]
MSQLGREDIERFRTLIEDRLGLSCAEWQAERLPSLLRERMNKSSFSDAGDYFDWLSRPGVAEAELGILAEHLTVGETYFFREGRQLDALLGLALPELLRRATPGEPLRILSAGCSSGEEAYTLAIALRQFLGETARYRVAITGIDMNPAAIRKARQAVYSAWSLRATPDRVRDAWFVEVGQNFRLREEIRAMVSFEERNLLMEDALFWRPGAFDVIFCRNVSIYFSPQATRAVVGRLERSLAPGGFLFLGHSESLRGLSEEFDLLNTHETFYYQRRGAVRSAAAAMSSSGGDGQDTAERESWVDIIHRSAERINAFTRAVPPRPPATAKSAAASPTPPRTPALATALELFKAERFEEAIALLTSLREAVPTDPDVELLTAVIYSNQGQFDEAERICLRLIRGGVQGDRVAAAHYLLGLCYENAGNRARAMDHHRSAIQQDPHFAMPHLHLGLLARRAGDNDGARAEMRLAADLVGSERPDRILLFGGGFHRNALLELCRAELSAVGEAP